MIQEEQGRPKILLQSEELKREAKKAARQSSEAEVVVTNTGNSEELTNKYLALRNTEDLILRKPLEEKEYNEIKKLYRNASTEEVYLLWRDKTLPMVLVQIPTSDTDAEAGSVQSFWFRNPTSFGNSSDKARPFFLELDIKNIKKEDIQKGRMRADIPEYRLDDLDPRYYKRSMEEFYVREKVILDDVSIAISSYEKSDIAFYCMQAKKCLAKRDAGVLSGYFRSLLNSIIRYEYGTNLPSTIVKESDETHYLHIDNLWVDSNELEKMLEEFIKFAEWVSQISVLESTSTPISVGEQAHALTVADSESQRKIEEQYKKLAQKFLAEKEKEGKIVHTHYGRLLVIGDDELPQNTEEWSTYRELALIAGLAGWICKYRHGGYLVNIGAQDHRKRFDKNALQLRLGGKIKYFTEDTCLYIGIGNHEDKNPDTINIKGVLDILS